MIRQAKTKDIPELLILFTRLLESLKIHGNGLYTKDQNRFMAGIMALLSDKMNTDYNIVLVKVNQDDKPVAFLVGWLVAYPEFFENWKLGEVQWMYPLAPSSRSLVNTFDAWAQKNGATARACYATPSHTTSCRVMERDGMQLGLHHYFKPYGDTG